MRDNMKKSLMFVVIFITLLVIISLVSSLVINQAKLVGDSMKPTYKSGDILFYKNSSNYEVGDVILYDLILEKPIARIIDINENGTFVVKGDGNTNILGAARQNDLEKEMIIGKVLFGVSQFIFYPLKYLIVVLLSFLLFNLIQKKKR